VHVERINRNLKVPYYQQLYEILRADISRGEWKPGDLIPGESELIKLYKVSRITVRQVLEMLVREGLIYRERGRGTFVAHPTVDQGLGRIVSFTEDMRQRGFRPASKILTVSTGPATDEIAAKLEIEPDEELACIERLRLADDEPMSVEKSYLVHRYCPGVTSIYSPATDSLREVLERRYGIHIARAKQVIRAIAAPRELAHLLSIPVRSPLLHVDRISYSQQGVPIEFLTVHYRADRYSLHNELHD
jgi:GntR family transcriptional regulator, N-acetylglucosamine utilization regulator